MEKYIKVKDTLNSNKCILLTTFEEFNEKLKIVKDYGKIRINFIGICSHKSSAFFVNFYYRRTGERCKVCTKKETSKILNANDKYKNMETEYESISYVINCLNKYYKIERTPEGCKADISIKDINNEEDLWIPIQVKSTIKM